MSPFVFMSALLPLWGSLAGALACRSAATRVSSSSLRCAPLLRSNAALCESLFVASRWASTRRPASSSAAAPSPPPASGGSPPSAAGRPPPLVDSPTGTIVSLGGGGGGVGGGSAPVQYRGAAFDKRSGRWKATITVAGRRIELGSFADAKTASDAYFAAKVVYADEQYAGRRGRKPRAAAAGAHIDAVGEGGAAAAAAEEGGAGDPLKSSPSLSTSSLSSLSVSSGAKGSKKASAVLAGPRPPNSPSRLLKGGPVSVDVDDDAEDEDADGEEEEEEEEGSSSAAPSARKASPPAASAAAPPPLRRQLSSLYRGVVRDFPAAPVSSSSSSAGAAPPPGLLWEAVFSVDNGGGAPPSEISGGEYASERDAALAHDALARMYLSPDASARVCNFPPSAAPLEGWLPPEEAASATGQIALRPGVPLTVEEVVGALKAERGVDVTSMDLAGKSNLADAMVFVTGRSVPHMRKMADTLARAVRKRQLKSANGQVEARDMDDWMVVDCGNIIVNVMDAEAREVFDLENLYGSMRLGEDPFAGMTYDEWLAANPIPEKWLKRLERDEMELEVEQRATRAGSGRNMKRAQ